MHTIKASEIEWVAASADRFSHWLIQTPGKTWTIENLRSPDIYRWTVSWIGYEGLFVELWSEHWFQDGIRAFGLMALEREGRIEILQGDGDGDLFIRSPEGATVEISAFLDGESLAIRHDPEYADLSWDPVSSMCHLLAEYDDS